VLLALTVLAGCGFRPLHGGGSDDAVVSDLAQVSVDIIADRPGQLLRNQLVDLLNPGRTAGEDKYRLDVTLEEDQRDIALERTGFATRGTLRLEARYNLIDAATGQRLTHGFARAFGSYNITDNKFSTLTAQQSARERAVREIGYDIRRHLAVYFAHAPAPDTAAAAPAATPAAAPPAPDAATPATPGPP
jgi:LPS-assembly lipoprotein